MARISKAAVEAMRAAIAPLDTPETRAAYRAGNYPRAELTRDLDTRYRWDLYAAAGGYRLLPEGADVTSAHIDTALRAAVASLTS